MKIIRCTCDGASHRIGLTSRGQLVALDHSPKFRREKKFAELGGRMPHCFYVIGSILSVPSPGDAEYAPEPIRGEVVRANAKRADRLWPGVNRRVSRPITVMEKYTALTRLAVVESLQKCFFVTNGGTRTWSYDLPSPGKFTLDVHLTPFASWAKAKDVMVLQRGVDLNYHLTLPTGWWLNVYKKGIAVMDGYLVLNATWRKWLHVCCTVLHQRRNGSFTTLVTDWLPVDKVLSGRVRLGPAPWSEK